eukprot:1556070-Amphidinium_carterae.1
MTSLRFGMGPFWNHPFSEDTQRLVGPRSMYSKEAPIDERWLEENQDLASTAKRALRPEDQLLGH